MLDRATEVIKDIRKETDSVILFHSMSGKDSIVLLDLLYPNFRRVACIFMYLVKDLGYIQKYADYAKNKYENIELYQVPHYALFNYKKVGFMGKESDYNGKQYSLSDIDMKMRETLGIEWCVYGFKQSDSLNRRLMLRGYKDGREAICWRTKKAYPLSTYTNADVMCYIHHNELIQPMRYSNTQSSGDDITDGKYLQYLLDNYPMDYHRICKEYPKCKFILQGNESEAQ